MTQTRGAFPELYDNVKKGVTRKPPSRQDMKASLKQLQQKLRVRQQGRTK